MFKNQNMDSSLSIIDHFDAKAIRRPATPNRYSPLLLMMLAACGGGGGGLGGPKVRVTDNGIVFSKVWENTKSVQTETNQELEKIIEKNSATIAKVAGKSPGKANISNVVIAPDGQSATYRVEYSSSEFSFLTKTVKVELVGDDAAFFRLVKLEGLSSGIEFITAPNYERPTDKNADNYYHFSLKLTLTYDEDGESEAQYTRYFVSVGNATGKNFQVKKLISYVPFRCLKIHHMKFHKMK